MIAKRRRSRAWPTMVAGPHLPDPTAFTPCYIGERQAGHEPRRRTDRIATCASSEHCQNCRRPPHRAARRHRPDVGPCWGPDYGVVWRLWQCWRSAPDWPDARARCRRNRRVAVAAASARNSPPMSAIDCGATFASAASRGGRTRRRVADAKMPGASGICPRRSAGSCAGSCARPTADDAEAVESRSRLPSARSR